MSTINHPFLAYIDDLSELGSFSEDELMELGQIDDGSDLDSDLLALTAQLGNLESEYAADELGAPYRRRVSSVNRRLQDMRNRYRNKSRTDKKLRGFVRKAKVAMKRVKSVGKIGSYIGFTPKVITNTSTSETLKTTAQVRAKMGQLVIAEKVMAGAEEGLSTVTKLDVGIEPMLGTASGGVPIEAFRRDSLFNFFMWPDIDSAKDVSLTIVRSVAPGNDGGTPVTNYSVGWAAGLIPYHVG